MLHFIRNDTKTNKMKLNWGTGIVIAIIAFMSFILYFVISMSTGNNYNHDLVSEEYYQKELKFQEKHKRNKKCKRIKRKY